MIKLAESRTLAILMSILYSGAVLLICLLTLPLIFKVLLSCACVIGFIYNWRLHVKRSSNSAISAINLKSDASWQLLLHNGVSLNASCLHESFVSRWIIILRFKISCEYQNNLFIRCYQGIIGRYHYRAVICRDAIHELDYSKLRRQLWSWK